MTREVVMPPNCPHCRLITAARVTRHEALSRVRRCPVPAPYREPPLNLPYYLRRQGPSMVRHWWYRIEEIRAGIAAANLSRRTTWTQFSYRARDEARAASPVPVHPGCRLCGVPFGPGHAVPGNGPICPACEAWYLRVCRCVPASPEEGATLRMGIPRLDREGMVDLFAQSEGWEPGRIPSSQSV